MNEFQLLNDIHVFSSVIIRQRPPAPVTPPPIIIRERPPTPPSYNTPQVKRNSSSSREALFIFY
jgi:hypothetical protein